MGEVSRPYPAPVLGVSTLPERNRADGQMAEQINMSSDPVQKLTRRPSAEWKGKLTSATGDVKSHVYVRDGKTFRIILQSNGIVQGFVNNVEVPVEGSISSYIGSLGTTVLRTINDTTVVVNQDKVVRMSPTLDTTQKVTHLNVTSALNYGEKLVVSITPTAGIPFTVEYVIPDIGATSNNIDAADKARATAQVAKSISDSILLAFDNMSVGVNVQGSTVAIWDKLDSTRWIDVRVATGQGDRSTVVINQQVENIAGLPLYAVVGTRITVRPNPTSDKGTYYLNATRVSNIVAGESTDTFKILEEVVWTETRSAEEPYRLDPATMPHTIKYEALQNKFIVGQPDVGWADRKTGDNQSCRVPAFVDNKITTVSYMQKRLVVLTENTVVMSRTDDIFNWWKSSAVQLLVTDPIEIASSATGIDKLVHVVPHNKDLLVLASNAQFKITGDTPVTPETVSMPLVATYNCSTLAEPRAIGSSVFLPVSYGDSCGVFEYTREQDKEQDNAKSVSNHVVGYMLGEVQKLVTSSNLDIVALQSTGADKNTLFIFEKFVYNQNTLQQSWSKWVFPFQIVDFDFIQDSLSLIYKINDELHQCVINLYSRISDLDNIFLDRKINISSPDGITFTVPDSYDMQNVIAVVESGKYKLNDIKFTLSGRTLTLERNIQDGGAAVISIGVPFRSKFVPTRPFIRDADGRVLTDDRLRVSRFVLNLVNTGSLLMTIKSDYYDTITQRFVSREVGGLNARLGVRTVYTGDHGFSYGHDASQATAEFETTDHLGLTVAGISWLGQFHQTRRRL